MIKGRWAWLQSESAQLDHYWSKVDKNTSTGCWLWLGSIERGGYGTHRYWGKKWKAHRLSYFFHNGEFDLLLDVCHTCDVRNCVNPDHLWLGTAKDNIQDMLNKGRKNSVEGELNPRATITEEVVREIRKCSEDGLRNCEISRRLGVNQFIVHDVIKRKSWAHI